MESRNRNTTTISRCLAVLAAFVGACSVETIEATEESGESASTDFRSVERPLFLRRGDQGDFDDDGELDFAIGDPYHGKSGVCNGKGAVHVRYGDGTNWAIWNPDEDWTRDSASVTGTADCGDYFGASVAVGDFDNDGYDDLAVGVPGDVAGTISQGGSIHLLYGTSTGLSATDDAILHADSTNVAGVAEANDMLGFSLASGDFNCDGYDDLAVGSPYEDIGSTVDAGAVTVLYGSAGGVTGTGSTFWDQSTTNVEGTAETSDYLGFAVAAGNFNNDTSGGHACDNLAIGVPKEDVGTISNAGSVNALYGGSGGISATGDQLWHQDSSSIDDTAEANDEFGYHLSIDDYCGGGGDDLVVRLLNESVVGGITVDANHHFCGNGSGLGASDAIAYNDPWVEGHICCASVNVNCTSANPDGTCPGATIKVNCEEDEPSCTNGRGCSCTVLDPP